MYGINTTTTTILGLDLDTLNNRFIRENWKVILNSKQLSRRVAGECFKL